MDNALRQNINHYFSQQGFSARQLILSDLRDIQDFIWECSDYYEEILGVPPRFDEAERLLRLIEKDKEEQGEDEDENDHSPIKSYILIGLYSEQNELVGIINIVEREETPKDFDIKLFLILPDYREQGLGDLTYQNLLMLLKDQDARTVYFKIRTHNEVGYQFLINRGFSLHYTGVERNYSGGASLYVIMKKILKRSLYVK